MSDPIISPDTQQLKRCSNCGEIKPLDAFHISRANNDGRAYRCKSCFREYHAEYYAKHAEEVKEKRRARYAANPEADREYRAVNAERLHEKAREYYQAHIEHKREKMRAYYRTPGGYDAICTGGHRRRARKASTQGSFDLSDLVAIRAAQTDKKGRLICWRCGKPIKGTPELDHWIPIAKGGRNDAGNLHYMHRTCNRSKHAKMPTEIGRLI
jgi:5-methylcytosine-specific restriction endonuclease McrA